MIFLTEDGLTIFNPRVDTVGFSAFAALYASVLALAVTSPPGGAFRRIFAHPPLMFFGRYAYALYVFHLLVDFELAVRIDNLHAPLTVLGSQIPMNIAFSLVCTVISVGLAWLSWHLFEKQVLKLKRFFPYTPRPAAQPARDAEIVPRFAAP